MGEKIECALDQCRSIFMELKLFWKLTLVGFVFLLGMGGSVLLWAQAIYQDDMRKYDGRLKEIEAAFNDIAYLRSQSNDILDNQKVIIKYLERRE